ncbi:hypothetical protein A9K97_gp254 [Tokyovirus A1]|uniref:hypothetical protein n=1 Tax=Tokyovirus A1 TaxID=1826170 RepID=UPI0007A96878|nr:hypothetical protein A9K97_gp254 [Tokyovirus A1]BAU80097.1 conserved hypothetical protein [Tokyovirus A1]
MECFLEPRECASYEIVSCSELEQRPKKKHVVVETPKTMTAGSGKGSKYTEKVERVTEGTYSFRKGTKIRHGPFESVVATKTTTFVWGIFSGRLVKKETEHKTELCGTFVNGKLEGEMSQKSWLTGRAGALYLHSTILSSYKRGVLDGPWKLTDTNGDLQNSVVYADGKRIKIFL